MTPGECFPVLSGLASLALMGASPAAAAPVTVPAPVDKLMRADKDCRDYDARHLKNARTAAKLSKNHMIHMHSLLVNSLIMLVNRPVACRLSGLR